MADTPQLTAFSDSLADAVAKAGASVVTVHARKRLPATGIAWAPDVVVTAEHVLERDDQITVTLPDGKDAAATIAGRDPGSDIAVLRIAGGALTPIARGGEARVGHLVLAVGRPGEGGPQASLGSVVALGGPWRTFRGGHVEGYLRTGVTFYPGFSGGPLVDTVGAAIGLNSSRLGRGAGLTIPIAAVATIVDALLAGGRIKRGYLGLGSQVIRLSAALAAKREGQETALLVTGVEPGSPADSCGVLAGDILVGATGQPLTDTDDLQQVLGPESVGKPLALEVFRGGEPVSLAVTVGERG